jgi:hypothetical protein
VNELADKVKKLQDAIVKRNKLQRMFDISRFAPIVLPLISVLLLRFTPLIVQALCLIPIFFVILWLPLKMYAYIKTRKTILIYRAELPPTHPMACLEIIDERTLLAVYNRKKWAEARNGKLRWVILSIAIFMIIGGSCLVMSATKVNPLYQLNDTEVAQFLVGIISSTIGFPILLFALLGTRVSQMDANILKLYPSVKN